MQRLRQAYCSMSERINRFLLVITLAGVALLVGGFGVVLIHSMVTGP